MKLTAKNVIYRVILFWTLAAVSGILSFGKINGQDVPVLSNLEEPTAFSRNVASDAWLAVPFLTGYNTGGYRLNSVSLLINGAVGNPSGFSVSLYNMTPPNTTAPFVPMNKIGELDGPSPTSDGVFSFEATELALEPQTLYSVVVTSETPIDIGYYRWSGTTAQVYTSEEGWGNRSGSFDSDSGLDWIFERLRLQYAIYATPIPTVSITVTDDQTELRWEGAEGVNYQVQTRASLTEDEWTDVGEPLTGDGSEITVLVPVNSGESQTYYRIEILPAEPASEKHPGGEDKSVLFVPVLCDSGA